MGTNLFVSLGNSLVKAGRTWQYGKQIGKMSPSGLLTFAKKSKNDVTYTTLDALTGEVRKIKNLHKNDGGISGMVMNADGNVTSSFDILKTPIMYDIVSKNQFANKLQTYRKEFNKWGQTTHSSDVFTIPADKPGYLNIIKKVNDELFNFWQRV